MLRSLVSNRWFALADILLVSLSGCLWALRPEIGILPIISIALLPWVFRSIAGSYPFRRTALDLPVTLFLATAWAGYWAAYDQETAWSKVCMIVLAVLFYYTLAGQPQENLAWICFYFFCLGAGVSLYFLLTHDFVALPRKVNFVNEIGTWITGIRPQLDWRPIHPNYVAGIAAILTPFVAYPAATLVHRRGLAFTSIRVFITMGIAAMLLAVFMATSRGSIMAIAAAGGLLIAWWIVTKTESKLPLRREAIFPALVILYLCAVIIFLYTGPAHLGGVVSGIYPYGTGSRAELFARSVYLVSDFLFTGGGLGAFPGLYSHYILGIPFFNVVNSHNLFLDAAIEQGLFGGVSLLIIYVVSIWSVSKVMVKRAPLQDRLLGILVFIALIIAFIHGMVDDYLYNGSGTILSLALAGLATTIRPDVTSGDARKNYRIFGFAGVVLIVLMLINLNTLRSAWYANIGAIQLAKVELIGFPTDQWTAPSPHPELDHAESSLRSALQLDPGNKTANHRLGLIAMLRGDFHSASAYLGNAYVAAPDHRGIIKSLGYSYAWSGDLQKALVLLNNIPETQRELDAYIWWWEIQGRQDLSENALEQATYLKAQTDQK